MEWITAVIAALAPTILTGAVLFYWQRRQNRRDAVIDKRSEARKCESMLLLDMQMATAKLAYANAMAIKRGATNGEVEDGINAYNEAKERYMNFMSRQAREYLEGDT